MTTQMMKLTREYFHWIYSKVSSNLNANIPTYKDLLWYLLFVRFSGPYFGLDENRAIDGLRMRLDFAEEYGYDENDITEEMGLDECSMLEMMVALSIRCEENIMEDTEYGDRVGQWFWSMIASLGLGWAKDGVFRVHDHYEDIDYVIVRFLKREYSYNGKGGLFTVDNPPADMRKTDIWYQMCFYLEEIISYD